MDDAEARIRLIGLLAQSFNILDNASPDLEELLAAIENDAVRLTVADHLADTVAAMIAALETLR